MSKGSTDGEFKSKHYFWCSKDSGMFVSLERLELVKDIKDIKKMHKSSKHSIDVNGDDGLSKEKNKELSKGKNKDAESLKISTSIIQSSEDVNTKKFEHKEGDPVWVFINDKPKRGVLKYIGRPPGVQDIFAGIEMVRSKLACYLMNLWGNGGKISKRSCKLRWCGSIILGYHIQYICDMASWQTET